MTANQTNGTEILKCSLTQPTTFIFTFTLFMIMNKVVLLHP